jgi:hypothetical protein
MKPGREHRRAIAERGPGQGVGDDRLDGLLTARAPVAVDGMLSDDRSDLLGNVLGDPSAFLINGPADG